MLAKDLVITAERLLEELRALRLKLVTAESCSGGLIAAYLTEIAGSSDVLERGFVTYSNEAKSEILAVPQALLARHGAVSAEVARAMAEGALQVSHADLAVSVTGLTGPGGGTDAKPVGLVYMAAARRGGRALTREFQFGDIGRHGVRLRAVDGAFALVRDLAKAR